MVEGWTRWRPPTLTGSGERVAGQLLSRRAPERALELLDAVAALSNSGGVRRLHAAIEPSEKLPRDDLVPEWRAVAGSQNRAHR